MMMLVMLVQQGSRNSLKYIYLIELVLNVYEKLISKMERNVLLKASAAINSFNQKSILIRILLFLSCTRRSLMASGLNSRQQRGRPAKRQKTYTSSFPSSPPYTPIPPPSSFPLAYKVCQ